MGGGIIVTLSERTGGGDNRRYHSDTCVEERGEHNVHDKEALIAYYCVV